MEAWVDIWGMHMPTLMEWGTFLGFSLAQATLEVIRKLVGVWKAITVQAGAVLLRVMGPRGEMLGTEI